MKNKLYSGKQTISILELLSTYRSVLMGVAILWIMFYHAPTIITNPILQLIKNRGFIGVDIFLFVSGYGLYHALLKKESIQTFYKKRFWRIFPAFFIVVTINYILSPHINFTDYLIELTTLGIWFQRPFYAWYISILVLLYALFPFYMTFFLKKPRLITCITILICFIISFIYIWIRPTSSIYLINRIPIFVTGIFFAYLAKNNAKMTTWKNSVRTSIIFLLLSIILKSLLSRKSG